MYFNKVYVRLWLMMFLQFILFAVWWVPLAAYLTNLGTSDFQKALILSSMAIGCIVSPVIGGIADRFFAAERVLAVLNITASVLLFLAAMQSNPDTLFLLLLFAMFAYMPTWGLTSVIAMAHSPSEQFPRIRLAGSMGWVASGIFSITFVKGFGVGFDGTNIPMFCGAGMALIAAFINLTLPPTPPLGKGKKVSVIQMMGLQAITLMKDKNFAIFILASFFAFIPFALYWSYLSQFLQDVGYRYITVTMNWGQLAEILTLFLVPAVIKKLGIRVTMLIGLLALSLRYAAFYFGSTTGMDWLFFAAILVHGIIYGFFSVGGQIYIDKVAPQELRAQAQGFIFLVTFGLGIVAGNFINAWLIRFFTITAETGCAHVQWEKIWAVASGMSLAVLLLFSFLFNYKNEPYDGVSVGDR